MLNSIIEFWITTLYKFVLSQNCSFKEKDLRTEQNFYLFMNFVSEIAFGAKESLLCRIIYDIQDKKVKLILNRTFNVYRLRKDIIWVPELQKSFMIIMKNIFA